MKHPHKLSCGCDLCFATDLIAVARRFREQRERGKVPVDPDAEQLAMEVGNLAGELERGAA